MVKGGTNIKFSIDFGLIEPLKSLIYKQYRVLVFNYNSIKSFIVNAELVSEYIRFTYHIPYARDLRETRIYTNTTLE